MYEMPPPHFVFVDGKPHSEYLTPNRDRRSIAEVVAFAGGGVLLIVSVLSVLILI